jgi:hypothetical protein
MKVYIVWRSFDCGICISSSNRHPLHVFSKEKDAIAWLEKNMPDSLKDITVHEVIKSFNKRLIKQKR